MGSPASPSRLSTTWRSLRRAIGLHRRLLAAGLAAAAVAAALSAISPAPPETVAVLAAARDLTGGDRLLASDVRKIELPPALVPSGALWPDDRRLGRVLAAPVREGQPLTDLQLVGRSLVAGYGAGTVAAPVRIADAGAVSLVRVGDRVDVLAAAPDGGRATQVVAASAPVVALPDVQSDSEPVGAGALIVLGVEASVAAELARAAVGAQLSLVLRG